MAKDGYRRPIRKWFAETAEGPLILLYGTAFGVVSGLSGSAIHGEMAWDASTVTAEQEETFTTIIDQKFSDIEKLQSQKSDILFSKQTAEFNDDFKLLKEFSAQEMIINRNIALKSSRLAEKLMTTPAISEKNAQAYSDKFNDAGLNSSPVYGSSKVHMKYRNECLMEASSSSCMAQASKKNNNDLVKFAFFGGCIFFFLSLTSIAARFEGAFRNWEHIDDIPTLKTKINGALKQRKRSKPSN